MFDIPPIEVASYDEKEIYTEIAEFHGGAIGEWVRLCNTFRITVSPELLIQVLGTDDVERKLADVAEAAAVEVDLPLRTQWEDDPLGGMLLADDYQMPDELPVDVCLRVASHFITTEGIPYPPDEDTVAVYLFMNPYCSVQRLKEHFIPKDIRETHWIVLTENNRHRRRQTRDMLMPLLGELGWATIMVKCLARLSFAFNVFMLDRIRFCRRILSTWRPLDLLYQLSATPDMVIASLPHISERERRMIQFFGHDPRVSKEAISHLTRIFGIDTSVNVLRVFPHPTEVEVLVLEGQRRVSVETLYDTYSRQFPDLFQINYLPNNQFVVASHIQQWIQFFWWFDNPEQRTASR